MHLLNAMVVLSRLSSQYSGVFRDWLLFQGAAMAVCEPQRDEDKHVVTKYVIT